MSTNIAYLVECTLYEKYLKQIDDEDYISEFQRAFPHLFQGMFAVTKEIEDLDKHRKTLARQLDEIPEDDERYPDIEDAIWYTYQYEVNTFYEVNKPRFDTIIKHYSQFLSGGGEKEEILFKIVSTPAGYWLATQHQSWLLAHKPFTLRYACKAVGIHLYRWMRRHTRAWKRHWTHGQLPKAQYVMRNT
jgi:hypothetical protein